MLTGAVHNILTVFAARSDNDDKAGMAWYQAAHTFAIGLSDRYGIAVPNAAGIIAALSPRVEWGLNMRNADTLCRTGTVGGLKGNVAKAVAIFGGAEPLEVLGGRKVRSFYSNISDPQGSTAVTIDRHAFDIVAGSFGNDDTRKALERKGMYEACVIAYRVAAESVGILPHQIQAVTWETWRSFKPSQRGEIFAATA